MRKDKPELISQTMSVMFCRTDVTFFDDEKMALYLLQSTTIMAVLDGILRTCGGGDGYDSLCSDCADEAANGIYGMGYMGGRLD